MNEKSKSKKPQSEFSSLPLTTPLTPPTPPRSQLPVIPLAREIEWIDGMPVPVSRPIITKESIAKLTSVALTLPYNNDPNDPHYDPRFDNLTNAEVMAIRHVEAAAQGNLEVTEKILDRLLGKATQNVETKNLSMSYTDFLKTLTIESESSEPQSSQPLTFEDLG